MYLGRLSNNIIETAGIKGIPRRNDLNPKIQGVVLLAYIHMPLLRFTTLSS